MGADVKQPGEAFAKSAAFLRWQDRAANKTFFAEGAQAFLEVRGAACSRSTRDQEEPKAAEMTDLRFQ